MAQRPRLWPSGGGHELLQTNAPPTRTSAQGDGKEQAMDQQTLILVAVLVIVAVFVLPRMFAGRRRRGYGAPGMARGWRGSRRRRRGFSGGAPPAPARSRGPVARGSARTRPSGGLFGGGRRRR